MSIKGIKQIHKINGDWVKNHPLYITWKLMVQRCSDRPYHTAWKRYGGRGIKVCDRWRGTYGFTNFTIDMKERPSDKRLKDGRHYWQLDRIDNNGNYCKKNCRWATIVAQASNRTNNHIITYKGEKNTVMFFEKKYFPENKGHILYKRLLAGWDIVSAIEKPYQK